MIYQTYNKVDLHCSCVISGGLKFDGKRPYPHPLSGQVKFPVHRALGDERRPPGRGRSHLGQLDFCQPHARYSCGHGSEAWPALREAGVLPKRMPRFGAVAPSVYAGARIVTEEASTPTVSAQRCPANIWIAHRLQPQRGHAPVQPHGHQPASTALLRPSHRRAPSPPSHS